MWRDDAVRCLPQRVVFRQGLRVRDVQRSAAEAAFALRLRADLYLRRRGLLVVLAAITVVLSIRFERRDQVRLYDNLPARDVRHEGILAGQDVKLRLAEQVVRGFGERHADDQPVDILRQEMVQALLVQPAVPRARELAFCVPRARYDVAVVPLARGRVARTGSECDDIHAHGLGHPCDLPADRAVTKDAEALGGVIAHGAEAGGGILAFAPVMGRLPGVEKVVVVGGDKGGHEDPFGDLWAVDAGRGSEGDAGGGVDGVGLDVVGAGGEEMD